jgi:hypothetical protein
MVDWYDKGYEEVGETILKYSSLPSNSYEIQLYLKGILQAIKDEQESRVYQFKNLKVEVK